MSNVVTSELDTCLGKRHHLQLHLDPDTCPDDPSRPMPSKLSRPPPITDDKPPEAVAAKRPCTMAARLDAAAAISSQPFYTATATAANAAAAAAAAATTTATTTTADTTATTAPAPIDVANSNTTPGSLSFGAGGGPSRDGNVLSEWDAASWDTNSAPGFDFMPRKGPASEHDDVPGQSIDESCRRALDHFPCPAVAFPTPTLEFDFRVAVTLKPEPSQVQGRAHKEITAISSGNWSGSFGHGKVMAGGYDLGQARGFRPIRIVEGAFIMQTTDEPPAILEMRTRGSLSGPCDILDALLSPRNPKQIDPRKYGFRMFLTIKTADKRYAEIVNCGLWVASGVWKDDELIIDAYRVT